MSDTDDAIAAAAVDLNADAKAKRKRASTAKATKATKAPEADQVDGDGTGEALPDYAGDEPRTAGGSWDVDGERTLAVDRMASMAEEFVADNKTLVFDLRDFLIETIKARPKPWSATPQAEQRDVAAACEDAARGVIRKIVEQVAANGVDSIRVLLTKVNMGTDIVISGKVKTYGDEDEDKAVLQLHRSINKHVMLTRATVEDYAEGDREPETDPDNPDFGFEGDDDGYPDD